jgi:hypothetical protein
MRRARGTATAAGLLFVLLALHGADAEARGRHHNGRWGSVVGAAVAGAVVGAVLAAPVEARVYYPAPVVVARPPVYYTPPPPPPVYGPPPAVYAPPVVYATPAPVYDPGFPRLGLSVMGTGQASHGDRAPLGGLAAALSLRTSSHTQVAFELQALGARRTSGGRRDDLAALVGGRVFFWNAAFAPYFELAGGIGRTDFSDDAYPRLHDTAAQLIGRFGFGLELRFGQHLVLDAGVARVHRLLFSEDDRYGGFDPVLVSDTGREHATELRAGIGFRF